MNTETIILIALVVIALACVVLIIFLMRLLLLSMERRRDRKKGWSVTLRPDGGAKIKVAHATQPLLTRDSEGITLRFNYSSFEQAPSLEELREQTGISKGPEDDDPEPMDACGNAITRQMVSELCRVGSLPASEREKVLQRSLESGLLSAQQKEEIERPTAPERRMEAETSGDFERPFTTR